MDRRYAFLLSFLTACSGPGGSTGGKEVPAPGRERVLQVYVLTDSQSPDPWFRPQEISWPQARVTHVRASSAAEADELLRSWNARPTDLLVLGRGTPQSSWTALKLPVVAGRKVVAVGPNVLPGARSVSVHREKLAAFLNKLCSTKLGELKGCQFDDASEAQSLSLKAPTGSNPIRVSLGSKEDLDEKQRLNGVKIFVRWEALLNDLLRKDDDGSAVQIDTFSGYLEISRAPQLKDAAAFDALLKEFALSELSGPST